MENALKKYLSFVEILFRLLGIPIAAFYIYSCESTGTPVLKLNDIQVVGSHNSYKKAIDPELMDMIYVEDSNLALTLDYEHLSIPEQLNLGMRNLELDLFHDPEGGRYSDPFGLKAIDNPGSYDSEKMKAPGFKVFHVQDIDFRSHHYLFREALQTIRDWSDNHPNHLPVIITINLKDEVIMRNDFIKPLPFGPEALDSVDLAVLSVMDWERLIHPDLIRGSFTSLEEAILKKGWPELNKVKGRFMFVLDASGKINNLYKEGHPSLQHRVMFINVEEGHPESAFRILNNPILSFDKIQELVRKGYMVRTRADANTIEARMNDCTRWERAKESGAQVISTDYYVPSALFKSAYAVGFKKDTVFRINPVRIIQ
jgi:hypothetical protein